MTKSNTPPAMPATRQFGDDDVKLFIVQDGLSKVATFLNDTGFIASDYSASNEEDLEAVNNLQDKFNKRAVDLDYEVKSLKAEIIGLQYKLDKANGEAYHLSLAIEGLNDLAKEVEKNDSK